MKTKLKVNFPQKSILGFKILSSLQSSIACYLILFIGAILNPFFGFSKLQIIAGILFNFLLNISVIVLTCNLFVRRGEIKKITFIFLNLGLFIYFPKALYEIFINSILIYEAMLKQFAPTWKIKILISRSVIDRIINGGILKKNFFEYIDIINDQ